MIFLVMIPLIISANMITYHSIIQKTEESWKKSLVLYKNRIERDLKYVSASLDEISASFLDGTLGFPRNELEMHFLSLRIITALNAKIASVPAADCYFFTSLERDLSLIRYSGRFQGDQKFNLEFFIKSKPHFSDVPDRNSWFIQFVGDIPYLFMVYTFDQFRTGAAVRLDSLILPVRSESTQGYFCFADEESALIPEYLPAGMGFVSVEDLRYTVPGSGGILRKNAYYLEAEPLHQTPLRLTGIWPKPLIQGPAALPLIWLFALGFFSLSIISISANFVYKEIKILKIASYEEQLEKQKKELQYLRMQIKPHFYLNAISTISSMSYQNRVKDIQKFIENLSAYLRYLLADYETNATIESEMHHAEDFIQLQRVRYPDGIFYMIDTDQGTENVKVPRLLIQTFIENIFKHAFEYGRMLSIFISAQWYDGGDRRYVRIRIDDNGEGFGEYLDLFNSGQPSPGKAGIFTIQRTLELQYGEKHLLRLDNLEAGGARVEILIPLTINEGGRR
jgi:hypothetical protein